VLQYLVFLKGKIYSFIDFGVLISNLNKFEVNGQKPSVLSPIYMQENV